MHKEPSPPLSLTVYARWDDKAKVWVATSEDVPGLATEAATADELIKKLEVMIPELIEENDVFGFFDEVPFSMVVSHLARRGRPRRLA